MKQSGSTQTEKDGVRRLAAHERLTTGRRAMAGGRAPAVALLIVLTQILLACSLLAGDGGGDQPAQQPLDPALAGPTLACGQECADRGLCGDTTDRGKVVLLGRDVPSLTQPDLNLAIADGATVTVLESRSVPVEETLTGSRFNIDFYRIMAHERGVEGWVAFWCILNPNS